MTKPLKSECTETAEALNAAFAMMYRLLRQFGELGQDARPGADALVEALEVVFLVRRMDVVVVEAEADHQRVDTERPLEVGDHGDRGAGAEQHGLPAPLVRE